MCIILLKYEYDILIVIGKMQNKSGLRNRLLRIEMIIFANILQFLH